MNIQQLVDAIKQAKLDGLPLNITYYEDVVWSYDDNNNLSINTDNDADDLYNGDGNTYSWGVYRSNPIVTDDGYVVFYDANHWCGSRETIIVIQNERADWE